MTDKDLADKLKSFTIPEFRRDFSKSENLFWLRRNIVASNPDNPLLVDVLIEIKIRVNREFKRI